ncbi:MAG: hypothetical protein OT477_09515 [Chloroflexi bacterium]|nr:hypothetical protein [Chloroflexota bacterium]
MSAYDFETVLKKWEKGELTAEQAIGQVLQLIQVMTNRVGLLERQQEEFRLQVRLLKPPAVGGVSEK